MSRRDIATSLAEPRGYKVMSVDTVWHVPGTGPVGPVAELSFSHDIDGKGLNRYSNQRLMGVAAYELSEGAVTCHMARWALKAAKKRQSAPSKPS